jgi:hypothetical protein
MQLDCQNIAGIPIILYEDSVSTHVSWWLAIESYNSGERYGGVINQVFPLYSLYNKI